MPVTGLCPDTLAHLLTESHISDVLLYDDPDAVHLFLNDGTRVVAILAITATDDGLHIELLGDTPYRPDRDEFNPYHD